MGGINASFVDGSTQLVHVQPKLAKQAVDLYKAGFMPDNDHFAWAFFRMLSGDPKWINAFPGLPPGATP